MNFKEKVLKIVSQIPEGKFLSYKEVARKLGQEKSWRAVANILAANKDPKIPCHRVIKNNGLVGGYHHREDLNWLKAALLLKEGAIGVIPTDTLYGLSTSAFNKKSVERVYKLRKRNPKKPCIILISDIGELKKFQIKLTQRQKKLIEKIKGLKVSFILSASSKNLFYLHRGTKTLSFRIPYQGVIRKILKISGPLIAPSANWEGYQPAKNIKEAKKYFNQKVFYFDQGDLISQPSTIVDLTRRQIKILREGADFKKLIYKLKIKTIPKI